MTFCEYQSAYCKNCGQTCTPEKYRRIPEDHEQWFTGPRYIEDWRSPCCHDQLSEDSVSQQCTECGATVDPRTNEQFAVIEGDTLCPCCASDKGETK